MHVHPRLTSIGGGIWIDPNPTARTKDEDVRESYGSRAVKILQDDKQHYERLWAALPDAPFLHRRFAQVADVAGGHPKLASLIAKDAVTVYDQEADMYATHHQRFVEIYGDDTPTAYEVADITSRDFAPVGDVAILCHIVEHLTIEQAVGLLGRLQTKAIIVYGPNIAAAQDDSWFHFKAADHITFADVHAMMRWMRGAGYVTEYAASFSDDYIIYGVKR